MPGVARICAFVEGWHGRRDGKLSNLFGFGVTNNFFVQGANIFNDDGFGFVSHGKFEQKSVGRELTFLSLLEKIVVKICVIILDGVLDNLVFRLKTLNKDFAILVSAFGAADDLSNKLITAFFGRKIR